MLLRTNDGSYEAIDFREMAPSLANKTMFVKNPKLARVGGLSVGVPYVLHSFKDLKFANLQLLIITII